MGELRKVRFSDTKLRGKTQMDANSKDDGNDLKIMLRESQSTVNQLTHQIKELP